MSGSSSRASLTAFSTALYASAQPRALSLDDVVALLGRAAKKDLFPLFRELGVKVDPGKTTFRQGETK